MEKRDVLAGLILELRRGTIVLCVLSQLKTPMYGYHLIHTLQESGIAVEANTLYPLLRRLESQGLLKSTWETTGTKARKYYSTTEAGDATFAVLKRQWDSTVLGINNLLKEGPCDE